jgi:kumamolisin
VDVSTPGYDLVTGLGSPNVDNLVRDLLAAQTGAARR